MSDEAAIPKNETADGRNQAETVDKQSRAEDLAALRERLERRERESRYTKEFGRNLLIGSSLAVFVALIFELFAGGPIRLVTTPKFVELFQWSAVLMLFLGVVVVIVGLAERAKARDLVADIAQLEFQIDLFTYELSERELKAEKLLRLNDFQLRRYYDLNLYQNRRVFNLGIGCIVGGVVIILATIYELQLQQPSTDTTLKIATATLGAIGAFLTNYVAAIYLKMNAAANENLVSFHGRLVETHQLMLGNLLASRIDNDELRWKTLAVLAEKLVPGK